MHFYSARDSSALYNLSLRYLLYLIVQIEREIEGADETVGQRQVGDENVGRRAHARRTCHRDKNETVAKDAERQDDGVYDDDDGGEPGTPQRLELGAVLQPLKDGQTLTVGREQQ